MQHTTRPAFTQADALTAAAVARARASERKVVPVLVLHPDDVMHLSGLMTIPFLFDGLDTFGGVRVAAHPDAERLPWGLTA